MNTTTTNKPTPLAQVIQAARTWVEYNTQTEPDAETLRSLEELERHCGSLEAQLSILEAAPELLEALGAFSMSGCEADVLNPCISGWQPGKPMMHWGGQDKMCRVCYARAIIAKAEGRS